MFGSRLATLKAQNDVFFATYASPQQGLLPVAQRNQRLTYFRTHPLEAAKCYLPEYVPDDYALDHYEVIKLLQLRGRLVVIILPRGFGKGTLSLIDIFHAIAFGTDRYIARIEHDATAAKKEVQKIAQIFTQNPQVLADFGSLQATTWRPGAGELYFLNGCYYRCIGQDQLVRGTTHLEKRLSVASMNDLIANAKEARSPSKNTDAYHLITQDVGKAGEAYKDHPLRQYYLGTCMAKHDLASMLCDHPTSLVYKFPAINGDMSVIEELLSLVSEDIPHITAYLDSINADGRSVTSDDHKRYVDETTKYAPYLIQLTSRYPSRFPMWDLIFDMAEGTDVFAQEMLHITGDTKYEQYHDAWFIPYRLEDIISDSALLYGITIDLAGDPKDGTDPCVVFGGAYHTMTGHLYPLPECVWCDQGTPGDVVYTTYQIYHRMHRFTSHPIPVFLEGQVGENGTYALFEEIRQKELALGTATTYHDGSPRPSHYRSPAYWIALPITVVPQHTNKIVRILEFRKIAEQRKVHYVPSDPMHQLMKTQFLAFRGESTHKHLPITQKIDLPDMVELFHRRMAHQGSPSSMQRAFGARRVMTETARPDFQGFTQ